MGALLLHMSIELTAIAAAFILGLVHIVLASHAASFQRGYKWSAGARDEPVLPLTGVAGRLARASDNYAETFPYFAALALAVQVAGAAGVLSHLGVGLYLAGRLAYLPLYAYGVYLVRSLAWNVATAGIAILCASLLVKLYG